MKRQILIYYANETSLSLARLRAVEKRADWIQRYGEPGAIAQAGRVTDDLRRFPRTTHHHIVEVQRIARESQLAGAVIFTNELARGGWYESQVAGVSSREPFAGLDAGRPPLDDAPLSNPDALREAFRETARRFPPSEHDFALITRSHGTEVMALAPALIEESLDRLPILEPASEKGSSLGWAELGIRGLGIYNLGAFYGIGGKGMILGGMKEASEGAGVTKREYLDVLEEGGTELGMEFRLVFMDSCGSDIPCDLSREVPGNVHALYGSRPEGLTYEAPAFERIGADLRIPDGPDGFLAAFQALLEETPNVNRFALDHGCCRCRRL